ncbi:LPS assembly lipoprotein LptE [Marivita sp. S2033]|uniref:LPS assembly lipoprotein LptE n=1 Tax=Marivita sp. S2033 TaxID=3373187 RepID=UPI003981D7B9
MWLHRRQTLFALGAVFAAAACGFTPVYGPQGAASVLQDNLRVETPRNHNGYLISQRLEDRLGRNDNGRYVLTVTPTVRQQGLATSVEGTTNRFQVTGDADYALKDAESGADVQNGRVTNFTGYSTTGSTVATLAAERDAAARLMVILADQIVDRLILSAKDLPE